MRRGARSEGSGRREEPAAAAIIAKPSLHPGAASLGEGKRKEKGEKRERNGPSIVWVRQERGGS